MITTTLRVLAVGWFWYQVLIRLAEWLVRRHVRREQARLARQSAARTSEWASGWWNERMAAVPDRGNGMGKRDDPNRIHPADEMLLLLDDDPHDPTD